MNSKKQIGPMSPCKNCSDRLVGCHSGCKRYDEYRAIVDKNTERSRPDREAVAYLCTRSYN